MILDVWDLAFNHTSQQTQYISSRRNFECNGISIHLFQLPHKILENIKAYWNDILYHILKCFLMQSAFNCELCLNESDCILLMPPITQSSSGLLFMSRREVFLYLSYISAVQFVRLSHWNNISLSIISLRRSR